MTFQMIVSIAFRAPGFLFIILALNGCGDNPIKISKLKFEIKSGDLTKVEKNLLSLRGGLDGKPSKLSCSGGDEVIVGLYGEFNSSLAQLGLYCRKLTPAATFEGNVQITPSLGIGHGDRFSIDCPNGQAATGLSGTSENSINALGLICSNLNDPTSETKASSVVRGNAKGERWVDSCPETSGAFLATLSVYSRANIDSLEAECRQVAYDLTAYVNTTRGSNNGFTPDAPYGDYSRGKTFPAVAVPFGFNFWTPVTRGNSSDFLYEWDNTKIEAFSISHEPSPQIQDYSMLQFMPMIGEAKTDPALRATGFSHSDEVARAHYYSVRLDNGIQVEMSPSDHAASLRIQYPASVKPYLLIDTVADKSGVFEVDQGGSVIQGKSQDGKGVMYFYGTLSQAALEWKTPSASDPATWLRFAPGLTLELNIATSFISIEQARFNLDSEIGGKSFDQVREDAAKIWNAALGRIEIEGATESQKTIFYSNLYRTHLYPNSRWENVAGKKIYASPFLNDQPLREGYAYVNNGTWDTARSEWPLLMLLEPTQTGNMLEGYVNSYRDGGWTPRWSGPGYLDVMLGTQTDLIFADAYAKGIRNFNVDGAFESMIKNSSVWSAEGSKGRKQNQVAPFYGYIPDDFMRDSIGWHLEDTIADFGISQLAETLGKPIEAAYYRNKALSYANVFSNSIQYFRGKTSQGQWRTTDEAFQANEWGYEYSQGNAYHYAASANHDPQGMINLYGGDQAFINRLDSVWDAPAINNPGSYGGKAHAMYEMESVALGQYAQANQPVHHMLYMYNYAGQPSGAAMRVRHVLDEATGQYTLGQMNGGGYVGDEDNGSMSAWFIFGALGFYPAAPGHSEYALGSPLFTKATIHLENGRDFVISAPQNNAQNIFIQSASLNGKVYSKNYLSHSDILAGGRLDLKMGESAASSWGRAEADRPHSLTTNRLVPKPWHDLAEMGRVLASGENGPNESAAMAFDNNALTKWLVFSNVGTLEYELPPEEKGIVNYYTITSADDHPERDPRAWILQGTRDGKLWVDVAKESDQHWTWRRQTRVFKVERPSEFHSLRLNIVANDGGSATQIAELELLNSL